MTAQTGEILIYKGKRYNMATEPLVPYIRTNNIQLNPKIYALHVGAVTSEHGALKTAGCTLST